VIAPRLGGLFKCLAQELSLTMLEQKLVSELSAFLLKEHDAPCSAYTHLGSALFAVIENFSQEEVDSLPIGGMGEEAIVEHFMLRGGYSERYRRFYGQHRDYQAIAEVR